MNQLETFQRKHDIGQQCENLHAKNYGEKAHILAENNLQSQVKKWRPSILTLHERPQT